MQDTLTRYRFDHAALRTRRKRANYTLTGFASQRGMSCIAVQRYEAGTTMPSAKTVLAMSALLGCKPGALFAEVDQ